MDEWHRDELHFGEIGPLIVVSGLTIKRMHSVGHEPGSSATSRIIYPARNLSEPQ